jgi:hypothetical protein
MQPLNVRISASKQQIHLLSLLLEYKRRNQNSEMHALLIKTEGRQTREQESEKENDLQTT